MRLIITGQTIYYMPVQALYMLMMKVVLTVFFFLNPFVFLNTFALYPNPASSVVEKLKTTYPNDDVVIESSTVVYNFYVNQRTGKIELEEHIIHHFISLRNNLRIPYFLFYNSYSEILYRNYSGDHIRKRDVLIVCGDFQRQGLFHHDQKVCRLALPFIEAGQKVTVETRKKYNDVKYFSAIPLQYGFAGEALTVKLIIPDEIKLELLPLNLHGFDVTHNTEEEPQYKRKVSTYQVKRVPASIRTENLPNLICYMPHLAVQPKYWTDGSDTIEVLNRIANLYEWYISLVPEPETDEPVMDLTDRLLQETDTEEQRMASIYNWIQDNIRYIAYADGMAAFVPEAAGSVLKKKYGDCKGKANLARAMLKHAGFDARLCWVYAGTYCYPDSLITLAKHNHMICAVKHQGQFIFLDPTIKFAAFKEIPATIAGKKVAIEDPGSGWIEYDIPQNSMEDNSALSKVLMSIEGDKIRVLGEIILRGYERHRFQEYISLIPRHHKEDFIKYFLSGLSRKYEIISVSTSPLREKNPSFKIDYEMLILNGVIRLNKNKLLNLDYSMEFKNQKIDKTRKFNYHLSFGHYVEHQIDLEIPTGYEIKYLPSDIEQENEILDIYLNYRTEGEVLIFHKKIFVKNEILTTMQFDSWNSLIDTLTKNYGEMLIFTRPDE